MKEDKRLATAIRCQSLWGRKTVERTQPCISGSVVGCDVGHRLTPHSKAAEKRLVTVYPLEISKVMLVARMLDLKHKVASVASGADVNAA